MNANTLAQPTVIISAKPSGNAARVLFRIAHGLESSRNNHSFGPWVRTADGSMECNGVVGKNGDRPISVVLVIGDTPRDVLVKDVKNSGLYRSESDGECIVCVGRNIRTEGMIRSAASQVIAWIAQKKFYAGRKSQLHSWSASDPEEGSGYERHPTPVVCA